MMLKVTLKVNDDVEGEEDGESADVFTNVQKTIAPEVTDDAVGDVKGE